MSYPQLEILPSLNNNIAIINMILEKFSSQTWSSQGVPIVNYSLWTCRIYLVHRASDMCPVVAKYIDEFSEICKVNEARCRCPCHPRDSSIRPPGEITNLCQTFVKLRTYTRAYIREMCLSRVQVSSPLLASPCGTLCVSVPGRGKFIYSRRSVFNPRCAARCTTSARPLIPAELSVLRLTRTIYVKQAMS